jgi:hypothetical protein
MARKAGQIIARGQNTWLVCDYLGRDPQTVTRKTTTLSVIHEAAVSEGHRVVGFAPTFRAAQKLAEAVMETSTLQSIRHVASSPTPARNVCMCAR